MINQTIFDRIIANDPTLIELDLSYSDLTVTDLQALVKTLEKNTYVNVLNVSGNPIGDIGAKLLAAPQLHFTTLRASECNISAVKALAESSRLLVLELASNAIGAVNAALFAENTTLRSLSLAGNRIGDEGAIALAKNRSLISLVLSHNKIGVKGAQALAKSPSLKTLTLSYNSIQAEGAMAFVDNISLESLTVAGNNIATPGIVALSHNTKLITLDASYNEVSDDGVTALAKHPALAHLNLGYNQITFRGAHALAVNTQLKSLSIRHNLLGNVGATALAQHKTLEYLDLAGNNIGFEGAYALARNKTLISLILSSNKVGDAGGVILAQNNTLTELFLSYNGIGDAGAIAFADNTTLKVLNLNYNKVSEAGRQVLTQNKHFNKLILSSEQPPEFTEENLDTIFLLSESFLCIGDTNGTLQFFNPAFSRVLGYSDDELLAKPTFDFLHPLDKEAAQTRFSEEKAVIQSYENRYRCKDGSFRVIRWTSHIKHNRQYAVGTDVTAQRGVEEEALLAKQESMLIRLQESEAYSKQQTDFIAHLSHEIRNPLSGIYGLMEILKEQIKQVERLIAELQTVTSPLLSNKLSASFVAIRESFNDMIACAEYQKVILNDNLDIVKISEKKFALENNPFELKKTLKQIIIMLRAKAHQKALKLNFIAPEQEHWVKGDATRLKQIIINLLSNAIKFTETGSIDMTLTLPNVTAEYTQVKIDITDTGIGLSPEEQNHLFERFTQASSKTGATYGGSGLGLYLAKQIANVMGGDIVAKSEQGKGSTFTVTAQFATLSLQEAQESKRQTVISVPSFRIAVNPFIKRTVLIVDDNVINQKILVKILEAAGHEYKLANDGLEALSAYEKSRFDVILMDIIMPKMDGITATKEIRKREQEKNLPRTPIFAITANALERDQAEGLAAGIDTYITKPFKKEEIIAKIAALEDREVVILTLPPSSPTQHM